jgi:hypothetical protein
MSLYDFTFDKIVVRSSYNLSLFVRATQLLIYKLPDFPAPPETVLRFYSTAFCAMPNRTYLNKPSPKKSQAPDELIALTKAYELVQTLTARVDDFPRSRKFVLGDRILANAYEVLDRLIEAKYSRQKIPLLDRVNITLEKLRFQLRLAHDEKLASTHQYEVAIRRIDEVGRLVGGWRKRQRQ